MGGKEKLATGPAEETEGGGAFGFIYDDGDIFAFVPGDRLVSLAEAEGPARLGRRRGLGPAAPRTRRARRG